MNDVVFIDTSAILALMSSTDSDHKEAELIYKKIATEYKLILTNFVIAETHALILSRMKNIKIASQWLSESAYKEFNVIRPEKDVELEAIKQINKYNDKDYSLTDMLSFLTMEKLEIKYFFSFDRHFTQISKFADIKSNI